MARGDKVAVRAVWHGAETDSGERMGMRGIGLWRIEDGLIVERWATVTPMHELAPDAAPWRSRLAKRLTSLPARRARYFAFKPDGRGP